MGSTICCFWPLCPRLRIAFLDPLGSVSEIPTLQCVFEELRARQIQLDAFSRAGKTVFEQLFQGPVHPFPARLALWAGDPRHTLRAWKHFLKCRAWIGRRVLASTRYDLAFAVNPEGAIAAHAHWMRSHTPFVYFSFEQMFRREMPGPGAARMKAAEVAASRQALLVVTQDPWRARLLADENGLPREKLHLLPVAPRGGDLPPPSGSWRARLALTSTQILVLHSGSWTGFTCAGELTDSLKNWPDHMVLVVNVRDRPDQRFVRQLEQLKRPNVRICKRPLTPAEYHELIQAADVGLACYQPTWRNPFEGRNLEVMGLSSGKTACYVRFGLPVVFAGQHELRTFLGRYPFGECAHNVREIPTLVDTICRNREAYSLAARQFFSEQLDFNLHWPDLWRKILDRLGSSALSPTRPVS
jgi:Glycosyl transferase 4-like domain